MNTIKVDRKNTKMVAHRGVSGLERENTNAAFVAAGNRSYWGVETDVHRTADGHFAIMHDANAKRVGGDNINIEDSRWETVRSLHLSEIDGSHSRGDLRPPELAEYISICKKYEKHCVLELKSDFTEEEIAAIVEIIRGIGWLENVTFIAFGYENLEKVKAILPEQKCQYLVNVCDDALIEKLKAAGIDLDISYPGVSEELVRKLHEAGLEINVWTVDNAELAARLIDWSVDYITSNILE